MLACYAPYFGESKHKISASGNRGAQVFSGRNMQLWAYIAALSLVWPAAAQSHGSAASRETLWVGTWAAAPQDMGSASPTVYRNQTLRLIVHVSIGGKSARVHLSNVFGDAPLVIGAGHIARRS